MIFTKQQRPGVLVQWPGGVNESPAALLPAGHPARRPLFRRWLDRFRPRREALPPAADPKAWAVSGSEALVVQQAAGTLFATYTTAKTVLNTQALYSIPAGDQFWRVGKTLRITVAGGLSNIVTTPGTVTMQVMVGSAVAFTTGAVQLNASAHTTLPFWLDVLLTVQVLGSGTAAKFMGMGRLQGIMPTLTAGQTDATNTGGIYSAPAAAPAQGAGFDSTIANVLDFWTGFSISNAGNGVQVQLYVVEALN